MQKKRLILTIFVIALIFFTGYDLLGINKSPQNEMAEQIKTHTETLEPVKLVGDIAVKTDKQSYTEKELVKIYITNNNKENLTLFSPFYEVLFWDDTVSRWIVLDRVLCPCGAKCKIIHEQKLNSQDTIEYIWNQEISKCSPNGKETEIKPTSLGKYRVRAVNKPKNQLHRLEQPIYYYSDFIIE